MLEVKVAADSIARHGVRLTTLACTYPRFIHAELLTHRMFSRNASSSRAIPVKEMIAKVRARAAEPVFWAKNQRGMTAVEELEAGPRAQARERWLADAQRACESAELYASLGLHKQIANRPLEPYSFITTVITATQWDNFLALRAHPAAQQEIQALAYEIQAALRGSIPTFLAQGEWHLPFLVAADKAFDRQAQIELSVARCARVSLLNHDGRYNPTQDRHLYERLIGERPPHTSPFEHVATPLVSRDYWCGNFQGWWQWRKEVEKQLGWDSLS